MKVSVTLSIDVDKDAWDESYGTGTDCADVRESVRRYVLGLVQGSAAAEEDGITTARLSATTR